MLTRRMQTFLRTLGSVYGFTVILPSCHPQVLLGGDDGGVSAGSSPGVTGQIGATGGEVSVATGGFVGTSSYEVPTLGGAQSSGGS